MKKILPLLLYLLCLIISCTETNTGEPEKEVVDDQNDSTRNNLKIWPMVKSVRWNVGVTHKLEFFYNADSTLNYYLSGSSNLPSKYKTQFSFKDRKLDQTAFESTSVSKYVYDSEGRVIELKNFNNGIETSRNSYQYNESGTISEMESLESLHGSLKTSWRSTFEYDNAGNIAKTTTITYNQAGQIVDTITRQIQQLPPPVTLNPFSLLHPLYQHQAHELFDPVVLSKIQRMPLKIQESGRSSTGPVNYDYHYIISDKLIMKMKCSITIGTNPAYDTAEAEFEY